MITLDDLALIRPAIVQLVIDKVTPTLNAILAKIKEDNPEWVWSRSTLYRSMGTIGFKYNSGRFNYYDRVREKTDDTKPATSNMKKTELIDWLMKREGVDENKVLLPYTDLEQLKQNQLWTLCQYNKPSKQYKIMEWINDWNSARGTDIVVNILPVAHPQLNPIELVWSWIKSHVASANHEFHMGKIQQLTLQLVNQIDQIDQTWWSQACEKSHKHAEGYIVADEIIMGSVEDESNSDGDEEDYCFDEDLYTGGWGT